MPYLAILDFLRKNLIPALFLFAALFLVGMAYMKGRWAASEQVNGLKLRVAEYEAAVDKCADSIAVAKKDEEVLKKALEEQQAAFTRIAGELEEAAVEAQKAQDRAVAELARRHRKEVRDLQADNDRLRTLMVGMTTAEACDAAMREVAR